MNNGGNGECLPGCVGIQDCGDGAIEGTEACDDGMNNGGNGECLPGCVGVQVCGDGVANGTEVCDDGTNDGGDAECLPGCGGVQTCGDGMTEGTEACDGDSVSCTSLPEGFTGGTATCDGSCSGYDTSACTGTCTVLYGLDVTFEITDTTGGFGDATIGLDGLLVLEFTDDGADNIIDGAVNVLHYWTYNDFVVDGFVTVTTKVHAFTPSCNGETEPTWRLESDEGYPTVCAYTGNTTPVASGTLSTSTDTVTWDACNAAGDYWSDSTSGGGSYQPTDASTGPGCLADIVSVGNVACSGIFCGAGDLEQGNNPQFATWTQPLINGAEGSGTNAIDVSNDASATNVSTPTGADGGFQSHNIPNETPSRTWVSWTGTRIDASLYTTCN